jgi:predicted ATP-binding protein involved in virulence
MAKDDELRDVIFDAAKAISSAQDNPRTWLSWVVHLLARLEERAVNENPASKESYLEMLSALQDEIRNRIKTGGWH